MDSNNPSNNPTQMSPFCEALMNATDGIDNLRQPTDAALLICTDGNVLGTRKHGLYPNALRMVVYAMINDDKLAELFTEAALLYSQKLQHRAIHVPFKEDTPIDNKNIEAL